MKGPTSVEVRGESLGHRQLRISAQARSSCVVTTPGTAREQPITDRVQYRGSAKVGLSFSWALMRSTRFGETIEQSPSYRIWDQR